MNITTIGIDLAKNVIQVHGVDERGKAVLKKQLPRGKFVDFFANLAPCLSAWKLAAARTTGRGSCR